VEPKTDTITIDSDNEDDTPSTSSQQQPQQNAIMKITSVTSAAPKSELKENQAEIDVAAFSSTILGGLHTGSAQYAGAGLPALCDSETGWPSVDAGGQCHNHPEDCHRPAELPAGTKFQQQQQQWECQWLLLDDNAA